MKPARSRAIALLALPIVAACRGAEPYLDRCPPEVCSTPWPASRPGPRCELDLGTPRPDASETQLASILATPERYMGEHVRVRAIISLQFERAYLFELASPHDLMAGFSFSPSLTGQDMSALAASCAFASVVVEGRVGPSHLPRARIALLDITYIATRPRAARALGVIPDAGESDGSALGRESDGSDAR